MKMCNRLLCVIAVIIGLALPAWADWVTKTVSTNHFPDAVAVNPVTNKIYVANLTDDVTVIDGATNGTTIVRVGAVPEAIAVNPVTNKIYVTNRLDDNVTVIDGATNGTTTVSAGTYPRAVAVNPVTNKIYVANIGSDNVTVINGADNSTTTVSAGDEPCAVVVNPVTNKIYVANYSSNNVTVINGADNSTTTVSTGGTPLAVAINTATNKIYVANCNSSNVTVINGATNGTTNVSVGNGPDAVAVNTATNKIYVANTSSDNVTVINGADNSTTTVSAGGTPLAVAINTATNKIYIANRNSDNVTVISGADNSTTTVSAVDRPRVIAVNSVTNKIYVANQDSNIVTVIDGATNDTTSVSVGICLYAVAVNPVTDKIYIANYLSHNVTVIDGATNATTNVSVGNRPRAIAVNPVTNKIYVANASSNNVTVINGADNSTTTVSVGNIPRTVAINPVTNKIYVVNGLSDNVTVIDGADNSTTNVSVGNGPDAVAVNPVTNKIYVANTSSDNVTVINGADNSTTNISVGDEPCAVVVNPVTNKIYVANCYSDNVTVINGADNSTATVSVGTMPYAVAVNSVTNKIYVANTSSDNVTVINGADNSTTTVSAGDAPARVAVNPVTNKIYVASSNYVTVIDGASNGTTSVDAVGFVLAVNPVTNKIYVAYIGSDNVTVITDITENDTKVKAEINFAGNTTYQKQPTISGKAVNRLTPSHNVMMGVLNHPTNTQQKWQWANTTYGSGTDSIHWSWNWGTDSIILGENFICVQPLEMDAASTNNEGLGTPFAGNRLIYPLYLMTPIITATAIGNGIITPNGIIMVEYNGNKSFAFSPDTGYHIDSVLVNGVNQGAITNYTFYNVINNHTITAYFSVNYYSLTVNIVGNGSVVKNPDTTAYAYDSWVTLTANAGKAGSPRFGSDEAGWHFMYWSDSLTGSNNPDSILINSDKVVTATFAIDTFTITASATWGGTISPSGLLTMIYGDDTTFIITPDINYHLDSLVIDGFNHGNDSTMYRFEDITDNHTISAYFSLNTFTLDVDTIGNGGVVIEPEQSTYDYGTFVHLTANPDIGWHFMNWQDSLTGNNNPDSIFMNSNKVVTATFAIDTFTINATATSGGTISPSGVITLIYGDDTTFTITPNIGHHLDSLIVDGINHGLDSTSYRFEDISASHTIDAYFSINYYTLTVNIIGNGSIIKEPDTLVYTYGTDVTLTAVPEFDWAFIGWTGDIDTIDNPVIVTMNDNKNITATFIFTPPLGWSQKESMPEASDIKPGKYVKDGASITAVNVSDAGDVIYTFPGQKSLMFYKYSEGVWDTTLAPIPFGYKSKDLEKINKKKVSKGSALLWDGDNIIYATKGNTDEFWAYYIDTDSWVQKAFVPVNKKYKGGTSMVLYDSKVYLLAGGQKPGVENNFFVYDPTADTLPLAPLSDAWFSLTSAPGGINNKKWKDGSCLALIGDIIYALKGGDKYNQMWTYDLIGTVWTEAESIPIYNTQLDKKTKTKDGGAMTTDGTVLYAIKGGGKQDFWMYTPGAPGTWTELEIIPKLHNKSVPKTGAALAWANNRVWLIKGNKTPEFWQYVPQSMSKLKNQKAKVISNIQTEETLKQVQGDMILSATPNPIKRNTQIRYSVLVAGKISIKLYNSSGRLVENLLDNIMIAGNYTLNLNANSLAKGVYFLKYEANNVKSELKLIIQ
jgi:YVTN family beta-propeller protein